MPTHPRDAIFKRAADTVEAAGKSDASWREVAQAACDFLGTDEGWCVVWRTSDRQVLLMEGNVGETPKSREYEEHYYTTDVLLDLDLKPRQWVVSDEVFPDSAASRLEFFSAWLRPHRVDQVVSLSLRVAPDTFAALSFHRHTRMPQVASDLTRGRYRRFTQLAHAAFSARYSQAAHTRKMLSEATDSDDVASFFVDAAGRLEGVHESAQMPQLTWSSFRIVQGNVRHVSARAQTRFETLVAAALQGRHGSIFVPGDQGAIVRVEARPAPASARLGQRPVAFVRLERRHADARPAEEDLSALFALSASEARVLQALCLGLSVAQCAERLGRSEATVRSHIANLLRKMHCARQSDLVRMAMRAG